MKKTLDRRVTVRLRRETFDALDRIAANQDLTVSEVSRSLLEEDLARRNGNPFLDGGLMARAANIALVVNELNEQCRAIQSEVDAGFAPDGRMRNHMLSLTKTVRQGNMALFQIVMPEAVDQEEFGEARADGVSEKSETEGGCEE